MTDSSRIETYMARLERALASLQEIDRADILAEIRTHLEARAENTRLDEALVELGSPEDCARAFRDELKLQAAFSDGGPALTITTLMALASRRILAAFGLFVSGVFFLLAIGFVITALTEIVAPDMAGMWVDVSNGIFMMGVLDEGSRPLTTEILGRWLIPVAVASAVIALVIGQWLGRLFLKLMIGRKPGLAV